MSMRTVRNTGEMVFQPHGRRKFEAAFDGGRISPDGGALLPREAERLAECFIHRLPGSLPQRARGEGSDRAAGDGGRPGCRYRTVIVAEVPRMHCPERDVHLANVPRAERGAAFYDVLTAGQLEGIESVSMDILASLHQHHAGEDSQRRREVSMPK